MNGNFLQIQYKTTSHFTIEPNLPISILCAINLLTNTGGSHHRIVFECPII